PGEKKPDGEKKDEKTPEEKAKEAAERRAAELRKREEAKKRRDLLVSEALVDFEKAVLLDPNHPEARLGRGMAYAEKSEFVRANIDFDAFARMNLKNHPLMNLVEPRMLFALRMAVMEESEIFTVRGLAERAYLYLSNGLPEKAEQDYLQILKMTPEKPQEQTALYNLCCIYSLRGDKKLAIEYLEKTVTSGYEEFEWMSEDPDLDNIRDEPRYKELVEARVQEKIRKAKEEKEKADREKKDQEGKEKGEGAGGEGKKPDGTNEEPGK
ncbi:MAG: tetratricopeptide repeat protein, partial [Planctomycetota bacterium]|nr:tetratricopeptide repeat protein [Planctomycetota bacterium]